MQTAEDKSKVHLMEDIMGISSDMHIQCNSVPCHRYPMTFKKSGTMKSLTKGGAKKNIDRDENKYAALLPFICGSGPGEVETHLNTFALPNC